MSRRGGARSGPHTDLVNACLAWLQLQRIPAWPMNTGAVAIPASGGRKAHFIRFGFPGCPDILGIIPGNPGVWLGVECKTGRGELSDDQRAVQNVVTVSGGVYLVARSIDDLAPLAATQAALAKRG